MSILSNRKPLVNKEKRAGIIQKSYVVKALSAGFVARAV
jgi:hypothetical protein